MNLKQAFSIETRFWGQNVLQEKRQTSFDGLNATNIRASSGACLKARHRLFITDN